MGNIEAKVISSILKNKDIGAAFESNIDNLFVSHSDIWSAIKKYYFSYKALPSVGWVEENFKDFDAVETNDATKSYIDRMRDDFIKRKIRNLFVEKNSKLADFSGGDILEQLFAEINDLNRISNNIKDLSVKDIVSAEQYFEAQAERSAAMGGSPGILSGFPAIDTAYHTGMSPGHLIVIIGWPSRGKSWFAGLLACRAMQQGHKAMFVTLEMAPENMRDRIYTMLGSGEFKNSDLSKGHVDIDSFKNWSEKTLTDSNDLIIVSTEGHAEVTPSMIQGKIDQHKPDIVFIDYHQLMTDDNHSRGEIERNRNVSRELKRMAVRNNIPVVDITAATMESTSDQKDPPMLSQVAWSKAIQYDADASMAVHRHDDSNLIEVVSRKNRYGPEFAMFLKWDIDNGVVTEYYDED